MSYFVKIKDCGINKSFHCKDIIVHDRQELPDDGEYIELIFNNDGRIVFGKSAQLIALSTK